MSRDVSAREKAQFVRCFQSGVLRPIQQQMVRDIVENHAACILGARQIGKTTALAYVTCCYSMGVHPITGEPIDPDDVQVASLTSRHSRDSLSRVRSNLKLLNSDGGKPTEDARTGNLLLTLQNGRKIIAHSGNPRSLQGFSGHTLIDELGSTAYDPDDVYTSSLSATSGHDDRRWVGSGNASYAGTWWHRLHTDPAPEWRLKRSALAMSTYTIHDAYPDGLPTRLELLRDAFGGAGSAGWRRWFLCEFVEGLDRALTDEEVTGCLYAQPDLGHGSEVVLGVDPGGWPNPTGICVVRIGDGGARVLAAEYWRTNEIAGDAARRMAWTVDQMGRIKRLITLYRPSRIVCDHAAIASHLGEALQRHYGDEYVHLVPTSTTTRQRRWGYFRELIRQGNLEIPAACEDLYADLRRAEIDHVDGGGKNGRKSSEGGILVLPQTPDEGDSSHILHCDILDAMLLTAEIRSA